MLFSVTVFIFVVLNCLGGVYPYSSGPPSTTCNELKPGHGLQGQTTPLPYTVTFSSSTYEANQQITVTITGSSLRGLIFQAVRAPGNDVTPVGSFSNPSAFTKTMLCSTNSDTWTHSGSTSKTNSTVTWTAPSTDTGTIVFRGTILQAYSVYWIDQRFEELTFLPPTTTTSTTTMTTTPITTTSPTTTIPTTTTPTTTMPTTTSPTTTTPTTTTPTTTAPATTPPTTTAPTTTSPTTTTPTTTSATTTTPTTTSPATTTPTTTSPTTTTPPTTSPTTTTPTTTSPTITTPTTTSPTTTASTTPPMTTASTTTRPTTTKLMSTSPNVASTSAVSRRMQTDRTNISSTLPSTTRKTESNNSDNISDGSGNSSTIYGTDVWTLLFATVLCVIRL